MITEALKKLRPGSPFVCVGETYEGLDWRDKTTTKPTREEVEGEVQRLKADYAAKQYQRQRATAYPSIADQLDTIYHEGIDAWKAQIAAVKQEYPKP